MFHRNRTKRFTTYTKPTARKLRFEQCEDRRMLATMADIIFFVDESASIDSSGSTDPVSHVWLQGVSDRLNDAGYADSLASKGITDIRYGLVGFSDAVTQGGVPRFAHSQVVDSTGYNQSDSSTFNSTLLLVYR